MNNIRLLLLGGALLIANATPVAAGGGGELIKAARVAVQGRRPVVLQASPISLNAMKGLTSILSTPGASTARFLSLQPPTPRADIGQMNPLKTGMAAQVVASEDRNLSSVSRLGENSPSATATPNLNLRLGVTETLDILRECNPAELDELPHATQQYLFLTGYPITLVEGPIVLTQWQINKAKSFYTYLFENYAPHATNAENLAKVAAAITDLGLIGDLSDAGQLVETVMKIDAGLFTGVLDVTAVRALINLGAYNEIKQLANFRLSRVDSNGRPMMLSAQWGDLQAYLSEVGVELNIPAERLAAEEVTFSTLKATADKVAFHNPYNLAHNDSSVGVSRLWANIRRGIEEKADVANLQANTVASLAPRPATPIEIPVRNYVAPKRMQQLAAQQDELKNYILSGQIFHTFQISEKEVFNPFDQAVARAEQEGLTDMYNELLGLRKHLAQVGRPKNVDQGVIDFLLDTTDQMITGKRWGKDAVQGPDISVPAKYHASPFILE
ncbi:MAG: hypothetical protein MJ053_04015 [Elusimicrobiaceae bacterium]|nr:hypothetical protein [Elusimicrobiaceae bacterium]